MISGVVHIVDDEESIRDSIGLLLRSQNIASRHYQDAHAFLATYQDGDVGCLILDMRMPRMTGLELQQELNRRGWTLPVIFITGHGDVPMAVEAMRAGAVDFLLKPFNDEDLLGRVSHALMLDSRHRQHADDRESGVRAAATLTQRERDVAECIVAGKANKVVAAELGLSERTVELHRARVMRKMNVRSVAQLVQIWVALPPAARKRSTGDLDETLPARPYSSV
jgi:two-component system, LuxR family, response regulator FixJ